MLDLLQYYKINNTKVLSNCVPSMPYDNVLYCAVYLHKADLYEHRSPPGLPFALRTMLPLVKQ